MRLTIWLCASVCLAACAAEPPSEANRSSVENEAEVTSDLSSAVVLNLRASESLDRIQGEAIAASASACHGTTSCPGGVFISGPNTVDCGSPVCGLTGCGKVGIGPLRVHKEQPREQYNAYAMPNGLVCLAYHPTISTLLSTCCIVDDN
jgi:hypothetical protein